MATPKEPSEFTRRFGKFVRSLRLVRGKTQEELAEACDLASDTIRRLEYGTFSPSLDTLRKLVGGLRIDLEALFAGFERGAVAGEHELIALIRCLSDAERRASIRVLTVLVGLLGTTPEKTGPASRDDG